MKKARNMLLVGLVGLTVASMYSVSGTYAKYTTRSESSDDADVAKWDIKFYANGTQTTEDLNLFGETAKIAPGQWGKVNIKLQNDSEVPAVIEYMKLDYEWKNNKLVQNETTKEVTYDETYGQVYAPTIKFCVTDPAAAAGATNKVECVDSGGKPITSAFHTVSNINSSYFNTLVSNNRFNVGASQQLDLYWYWEGATSIITLDQSTSTTDIEAYVADHKADTMLGLAAKQSSNKPQVTAKLDFVVSQKTN